jgi:hypothetical protein
VSRVRVYLKSYDANGDLWSEFLEITKYVDIGSIGTLSQQLDNTEFDIGIVRNSNISLRVFNGSGLFSTPDIPESLFRFQRNDSIVRITWNETDYDLQAGFFNSCGERLCEDKVIFEGLINDDASNDSASQQLVTFQVLGYESLLSRMKAPFADINNGDTLASVFYKCLNQSPLVDFVSVDAANIDLDTNISIDDRTSLENLSVLEALRRLMLLANSVLYIDPTNTLYVQPRVESASVRYTFYGPGSDNGIENIVDLSDVRSGVNRVFNFVTWAETSLVQSDESSLSLNGTRIKQVDSEIVTDSSKRNTILSNILSEFKNAKKEIMLKSVTDCDVAELFLLDKVAIDFPTIPVESAEGDLPLYDSALYDSAFYPQGLFNISIEMLDNWKIIERKFDVKNEIFHFRLRAV